MKAPAQYVGPAYGVDDIAFMWGLTQDIVAGWVEADEIRVNPYGQVTRAALMVFINSEHGQSLLRDARTSGTASKNPPE